MHDRVHHGQLPFKALPPPRITHRLDHEAGRRIARNHQEARDLANATVRRDEDGTSAVQLARKRAFRKGDGGRRVVGEQQRARAPRLPEPGSTRPPRPPRSNVPRSQRAPSKSRGLNAIAGASAAGQIA